MRDVVIFGAGRWGKCALQYYKDIYNVVAFVDNDLRKNGTTVDGVSVFLPDYLKGKDAAVVIANKKYEAQIKRQLYESYGIESAVVFSIGLRTELLYSDTEYKDDEIIVRFISGLGNQLFQYTLYRYMESYGINVSADLSFYGEPGSCMYSIQTVFPRVRIKKCSPELRRRYCNDSAYKEKYFKEKDLIEEPVEISREDVISGRYRYIDGYHQCYFFAEDIKDYLFEELEFPNKKESKLEELGNKFSTENYVSVHIRRGDYLSDNEAWKYCGICDERYYKKAIDYIKSNCESPRFVFFSDDIEWVSTNYGNEESIYISNEIFEEYQDWYDMYLMSCCKHNIIANSTFSWWGAWLNRHAGKIVVAPDRWINAQARKNICPPEWIRI